jgi:cell division protein ZapB
MKEIDHRGQRTYIVNNYYDLRRTKQVDNQEIKQLESRIDDLIDACQRLKTENQRLQTDQTGMTDEHERLVEKTRIARSRIQGMIERLKALEHS